MAYKYLVAVVIVFKCVLSFRADLLGTFPAKQLIQYFVSDSDGDAFWHEDVSLWDGSDEDLAKASDLDREWHRRHHQFHTVSLRIQVFHWLFIYSCCWMIFFKPTYVIIFFGIFRLDIVMAS